MNINISEIIENKLAQMEKDRVIETKIEQAIEKNINAAIDDVLGGYTLRNELEKALKETVKTTIDACRGAIELLEEPRKDEVILTKKEYGELVSSEYDNGYAQGFREALEQQEPLDHIRAEIDRIYERKGNSSDCLNTLDELKRFIDKYKAESEVKE